MPSFVEEIEAAIAKLVTETAFVAFSGADAGILVWNTEGDSILWASPAAEALRQALSQGEDGKVALPETDAARLKELAHSEAPRQGMQLERLRLNPLRNAAPLTCVCRMVEIAGHGDFLVTAIAGPVPSVTERVGGSVPFEPLVAFPERELTPPQIVIASGNRSPGGFSAISEPVIPAEDAVVAQPDIPQDELPQADNPVNTAEPDIQPEANALPAEEPIIDPQPDQGEQLDISAENRLAYLAQEHTVRFMWQADSGLNITALSPALSDVVGPVSSSVIGMNWLELLTHLPQEHPGAISTAFERGATWSGEIVFWPIDGCDLEVGIDLAGLPVFGPDRKLSGYSGFGLCRADSLRPRSIPAPEEIIRQTVVQPQEEIQPARVEPPASPPASPVIRPSAAAAPVITVPVVAPSAVMPPVVAPLEAVPPAAPAPEGEKRLSDDDKLSLREIARALGGRRVDDAGSGGETTAPQLQPLRPPPPKPEMSQRLEPVQLPPEPEPVREEVKLQPPLPPDLPRVENIVPPEPPASTFSDIRMPILPEPREQKAEASFRETEELLDQLPTGVLVHRGEEVLFANSVLLNMIGYSNVDKLAALGVVGLFRDSPVLAGREGHEQPFVVTNISGEKIAVDVRLSTIEWQQTPASLMLIRQSAGAGVVEKLHKSERDSHERGERIRELESILATATDGILTLDETGRILSLNSSGEALFGYDSGEVIGEAVTVLLAPESHMTALDYLDGLRLSGVASLLEGGREVLGKVKQGGIIPLFMTIGRINDGGSRKLCAVLRDITAFKQAESELLSAKRAAEEASEQKSDLLAKISHEIRTPLNAIIGFAEMMLEERFGPIGNERYKSYLQDMHASGSHVMSLVNDLLDLAKIEAGHMDLAFASVYLNDLVASCVGMMQQQASRGQIIMRTSFAHNLPPVVADERSVRQIILNLVSNAIKFTDAGGQVIVSTAMTDRGEVVVRVRDTGIGMDSDDIAAAMEPFRQLATSRQRGGTGLGLPLTKALIEANRGSFEISSARNEGTLVEVIFPPTRVLAE